MKRKIVLISYLLLIATVGYSQRVVYDRSKRRQWQAMEAGEIKLRPKLYYLLFHNNYRRHCQNMSPLRAGATASALYTAKYAEEENSSLEKQVKDEAEKTADCTIDAAYLLYKKTFQKLQDDILKGLSSYMQLAGGSKINIYENMLSEYRLIEQQINTTHGAYMENAYKEQLYIGFKKSLLKLMARINTMSKLAYAEKIIRN